MTLQHQIDSFLAGLPAPILRFIKTLQNNGIRATLIGGSVRNYFHLNEENPLDLDFEIRHNLSQEGVKKVLQQCSPQKIECLPFDILRLTIEGIPVELSPPRREIFAQKPWFKHSQFKAVIDPTLTPQDAWVRRDFTVNAIGIDMDSKTLVDPFNGMKDLKNNILRPCSSSFFYDPVRFLRLIRFRCQYNFTLHPDWKSRLGQFNLKGLTPLHFFKESFKSPFCPFITRFFDTVHKYAIALPPELEALGFLSRLTLPPLEHAEDLLLTLIHAEYPLSFQERQAFAEYAQTEKKFFQQHWNFRQNLEQLRHADEQFFQHQLKSLSLQDFLALKEIRLAKKVHQFFSKNTQYHPFFNRMEQLNPALFKTLSSLNALFPPVLKGTAPFPADVPTSHRGEFLLYCHLKSESGRGKRDPDTSSTPASKD